MKYFIALLCFFLIASCKQESSRTREELNKLKAELEAKKQELSDKQAIADIEKELNEVNKEIRQIEKGGKVEVENIPVPGSPIGVAPVAVSAGKENGGNAQIIGLNVTMRKDASVQSEKLGSFNANEKVEVLETKNVNNDREAILSKPITVKGQGGEANLPKGKAVIIEEYQSERNMYAVTYEDPQKGKLSADIDANAVETITYSTWYRVKRANGETGWVLGKFLKLNQD